MQKFTGLHAIIHHTYAHPCTLLPPTAQNCAEIDPLSGIGVTRNINL